MVIFVWLVYSTIALTDRLIGKFDSVAHTCQILKTEIGPDTNNKKPSELY